VYSASSSKDSAQVLPQKRRTLSSGFSQYQHEPLAGRLWREGIGRAVATAGSGVAVLSGKLSCIVSTIPPTRLHVTKARLLQRNTLGMINLKVERRIAGPALTNSESQCALNALPLQ
jgi:hypothetical protein